MAQGIPVRTVGDLIARLSEFDPATPVRVQHGLATESDFIVGVGLNPDEPGTVAIVYMPPAGR
jgi:hypothetical protein